MSESPAHRWVVPRNRVERYAEVQRRVLRQDRAFHPGDVVARLDAQLVHQHRAQVLEHPQGLGLAAGPVQREHALRPQPLAHRVGARQRLELSREGLVPSRRQAGIDPGLDRGEQQLLQPARLGTGERLVAHLAVGGATPELLRLDQQTGGLARPPPGQLLPALGHQVLESGDVGHLGRHVERVPRGAGHDEGVGRTCLAQSLAQPGDGGAQRDLGAVAVVVVPQRVDQPVDGHDELAVDEQACDERPRLGATDVDRAPVPGDLDRAQDADL